MLKNVKAALRQLRDCVRNEDGAAAVEYGLLVGLIAVVVISAITSVGTSLSSLFREVATNL